MPVTFDHSELSELEAIELDPRHALAWSGLSEAWAHLGVEFLEGAPMQEAYAKARAAADRACPLAGSSRRDRYSDRDAYENLFSGHMSAR